MGEPHDADDDEGEAERADLAGVLGDQLPDTLAVGLPLDVDDGQDVHDHRHGDDRVAHADPSVELMSRSKARPELMPAPGPLRPTPEFQQRRHRRARESPVATGCRAYG